MTKIAPLLRLSHITPISKNRLSSSAIQYPKECRLIDDDEQGCKIFEVKKGRFGFKLAPPYTEKCCKTASELAKNHIKNLWRKGNENPVV